MIIVIGVTKGKHYKGIASHWHTKKPPCKTHREFHWAACILLWHLSRMAFLWLGLGRKAAISVQRSTSRSTRLARATSWGMAKWSRTMPLLVIPKSISPLGGFIHCGKVTNDFVMLKDCLVGTRKRIHTPCKSLLMQTEQQTLERINFKFVDTTSKFGHGCFQIVEEKKVFMGPLKKDWVERKKKGPSIRIDCTTVRISMKLISSDNKKKKVFPLLFFRRVCKGLMSILL